MCPAQQPLNIHNIRLLECHHYCPCILPHCRELTTLWVARLDEGTELKVTDPKEQQRDVEEEETKGEERRDGVDWG